MARSKRLEQDQARALRALGWSLPAIEAELGVSRSSVSLWCRDIEVPPGEWTRRLRAPAAGRKKNPLQAAKEAEIERLHAEGAARLADLSEREHLIAGVALYAGEGTKGGNALGFANTNPEMVRFFCAWLRRHFDIDESRLRMRIYLHEGLDLDATQRFWSEVSGVPVAQFRAAYRAVPDPTIRKAKHLQGCAYVGYSCATTKRTIMGLVEALLSS